MVTDYFLEREDFEIYIKKWDNEIFNDNLLI